MAYADLIDYLAEISEDIGIEIDSPEFWELYRNLEDSFNEGLTYAEFQEEHFWPEISKDFYQDAEAIYWD
jgi:hypothetical protein